MTDELVAQQPAKGKRYVGVAVIPRRRRPIERALARIVELGGEALLITADGSSRARGEGVEHLDLLNAEMKLGPNRIIAVSPKRVVGKLTGRTVGGRSLLWRGWVKSRPYKVVRFYALWHALKPQLGVVRPADVTNVLLAGVESWPIAWHLAKLNPDVEMGWNVPDEWKRPPEDELLGLRRVAVWGGPQTWNIFTQGGEHGAEVTTFPSSSWVAQAGDGVEADDLLPEGDSFEERGVRDDLRASVVDEIVALQPEVVVLDALGELADLVRVGDWATASPIAETVGLHDTLRERADRTLAWDSPERQALFAQAVRSLAARMTESLPGATFVLHRAWLTDHTNPAQPPAEGHLTDDPQLNRMNAVLATYYEMLEDAFGERLVALEVPSELRIRDRRDTSDVVQAAFIGAYSEAALEQLDRIVRERVGR